MSKQEYLLSRTLENQELSDYVENLRMMIASTQDKQGFPKYDLLSRIAERTPFFVYDHPEFTAQTVDTAFTDGHHVFFHADFLKAIVLDDFKSKQRRDSNPSTGALFLALHEASHIGRGHTEGRMRDCPDHIRPIATDMAINITLKFLYGINEGEPLKCGWGLTQEEANLWKHISEETIAVQMIALQNKVLKELKEKRDQLENQSGNKGQGGDENPQNSANKPDNQQGNQPGDQQGNQPGDQQGNQPVDQQGNQPDNQQGNQPGNQQGNQPGDQQGNQPGDQQGNQPGDQQGNQPGDQQGNQPGNQQGNQPGNQQGNQPGNQQGNQPGNQSGNQKSKSGLGSVSVPQMSKELQSRLMNSMVNGAVNNASKNFNGDHVKDLAKTIKALESAGLTNVMKALKLPSSDEIGRIEEMKAANAAKLQEDVKKLEQERREYALNSGHGAHTQDVALDYIQKRDKSKKMYKTAIRDIIIGADGVDYLPNEDIPAPLYFLDPSMMGLSDPVYLDALVPAKKERGVIVVLTDSSGSMGLSEIGQSISESYRLVEEQEDETGASKVYFWSADTALRGKPVLMTRQNAAELCADMPIFGRGGTDVTIPLAQVMDWSKTNRVKIDGIIYITDMDVPPPQRSQLPELLPPLVFIGVGHNPDFLSSQLKTWVPACRDFAKVTCVDIREEIDFSALADDLDCGKYYESTDGYDNTTIEDEFIQVSRPKP